MYEFQTRPHSASDSHQLSQISQIKNGKPCLLPTFQKIETIFDFFLIIRSLARYILSDFFFILKLKKKLLCSESLIQSLLNTNNNKTELQ